MQRSSYLSALSIIIFAAATSSPAGAEDWKQLFDGKSLNGWFAVPKNSIRDWSIKDGVLVGKGTAKRLSYLMWKDQKLADFELKLKYKMATTGNTGVEIRCHKDTSGKRPFEGYHADFGHVGIGPNVLGAWDFHFAQRREHPCPRGTSLVINPDQSSKLTKHKDPITLKDINKGDWNEVHVIARGRNLKFYLNGKLSAEFTDNAPNWFKSGAIGLQIHDKGMEVHFKDIVLKKL